MSKVAFWLILAFLALLSVGVAVYAQEPTGTITGTIKDESGGVIPNAKITMTNKAHGVTRAVTANSAGLVPAPRNQIHERGEWDYAN